VFASGRAAAAFDEAISEVSAAPMKHPQRLRDEIRTFDNQFLGP
jgi:hypothetical protein